MSSKIVRDIIATPAAVSSVLVGVQSNQYPRALDLARQFRKHGVTVAIGGFHVSGVHLDAAGTDAGIAGGARSRLSCSMPAKAKAGWRASCATWRRDGEADLQLSERSRPTWTRRPSRSCRARWSTRVAGHYASFDAGRGCPFQCSFCTIINVQGRKSRYRTADDVEGIVRENAKQDITRFFITDDNYARNKNWEPILDRLIDLRENEGFKIRLLLQVDTLCHKIPGLHREGGARRLHRGVHRARKHQPGIAGRRQEAAEQDLGIPGDVPRLAQAPR